MAQRSLLCIDPDGAAVSEIRRAFGAYGFRVESIPNGEHAVEWARTNNPALIILSVEPRKVGYAICNKLKRSPSLREIPLILVSAEETMATFEQHKKLKSRAEEYLLKPLDMHDLLGKADRLIALGDSQPRAVVTGAEESAEIEIADDEIAEVSLDEHDDVADELVEADDVLPNADQPTLTTTRVPSDQDHQSLNGAASDGSRDEVRPPYADAEREVDELTGPDREPIDGSPLAGASASLGSLGDLSRPHHNADLSGPSPFVEAAAPAAASGPIPFDPEQFDQETQAAFAALEAGAAEGGDSEGAPAGGSDAMTGYAAVEVAPITDVKRTGQDLPGDVVDLQSLWGEEDLPAKLPWEDAPATVTNGAATAGAGRAESGYETSAASDGDELVIESEDPYAGQLTPPPARDTGSSSAEDALLAGLGSEVPPLPEEVVYDDHVGADAAAKDQRISELEARLAAVESERQQRDEERRVAQSRVAELQTRIASLEEERQTVRKEQDEQRERMNQAASQGAFSKERDLLGLREIINKKEKDILDLRDALDAKERLILDHKDKIRENERARRDLEERTLGFEKNLVAANERVAELAQDKEKSVERERGLKARLDDAHEELRKGQDELEALRKRVAQEIERGRIEVDKTRIELEAKLTDAEESHRNTLSKATESWSSAEAAEKAAHLAEVARLDGAHRAEVEALQRRLSEEVAGAADRLQNELLKLRRDQEKTIASLKEEQALQLASEREAYESQTEAKHRAYRDEVMGLRRRHEEELAAAEDRRQRDILEQEQRRVVELEQAETRRRVELQARDEEHHARVTELERRHLIEKTELGERHRTEHDQAVGRAVRAEGELVARAQEIEQAYRRLAGFEADLDAARAELGDRDVKLSQFRDRVNELEAKMADYEDQIVRAFQRLRSEERTTEKVRRALAVGLALLDERTVSAAAPVPHKSGTPGEEAEKS